MHNDTGTWLSGVGGMQRLCCRLRSPRPAGDAGRRRRCRWQRRHKRRDWWDGELQAVSWGRGKGAVSSANERGQVARTLSKRVNRGDNQKRNQGVCQGVLLAQVCAGV